MLGATAAREASAYAVLRKKSDATEQLLHGMGELHTELLTVQQREESARAALRSMSSQKDKLDSKIHELKRELNKVKKSAEGRLQQAKSLAAMHARSSRSRFAKPVSHNSSCTTTPSNYCKGSLPAILHTIVELV